MIAPFACTCPESLQGLLGQCNHSTASIAGDGQAVDLDECRSFCRLTRYQGGVILTWCMAIDPKFGLTMYSTSPQDDLCRRGKAPHL